MAPGSRRSLTAPLTSCVSPVVSPRIEGNAEQRDRIMQQINERGVPCFSGSCSEVYLEKAFDGTGWRPEQPLPVAHELGDTSLMFLVHPTLTQAEIDKTCEVLVDVVSANFNPA